MAKRAVWLRDDQWDLIDQILETAISDLREDVRLGTKSLTRAAVHWCVSHIAEIRDTISAAKS
jgi:hypothetical protein